MECDRHHVSFTLYPPGYVPYGREPLTPDITVDGRYIVSEATDNHDYQIRLERFGGTFFQAAVDAGLSEIWPKEETTGSLVPRFSTQLRKLDKITRLMGIHRHTTDGQSEEIADVLGIPGQLLTDARNHCMHHPSNMKTKGRAVCKLLLYHSPGFSFFEPILNAGSIAGLWPSPYFFHPAGGFLKKGVFSSTGIRGSPG